uniref:Serpentine receptor class gamma n=1 Tax=Strongyloides venezuelensis TaxID=75913 RepID=A0A0K0FHR7_STRVS
MYLFFDTIFSQCPNENYCIVLSIMSIIVLILQISLIIYVLKFYRSNESDYIKFLIFLKILSTIVYTFHSIFGEIRTFFPRKTFICYGIIRFFGDKACQTIVVR